MAVAPGFFHFEGMGYLYGGGVHFVRVWMLRDWGDFLSGFILSWIVFGVAEVEE